MAITVHKHRCPQNHRCPALRVCPVSALAQNGFSAPLVDEAKCIDCGKCVRYCPMGALQKAGQLEATPVSEEDWIRKLFSA